MLMLVQCPYYTRNPAARSELDPAGLKYYAGDSIFGRLTPYEK